MKAKDYGVVDQDELKLGNEIKIVLQVKSAFGKLMLDVRKWYLFPNETEWKPKAGGKNGICIEMRDMKLLMPKMQALMDGSMNGT